MFFDPKGTDGYMAESAGRGGLMTFTRAQEFFDARPRPRLAVLRPRMDTDFAPEAEKVLDYIIRVKSSRPETPEALLVLDEAYTYANKQKYHLEDVRRIIASGRGFGVSTCLISQHPNFVPNDAIQNMDLIMVWAAHPPSGRPAPHYITVEWWETHFGPWPAYADSWLKSSPHRAVATDHSAVFLVDPNGVFYEKGTLSREAAEDEDAEAEVEEVLEEETEEEVEVEGEGDDSRDGEEEGADEGDREEPQPEG